MAQQAPAGEWKVVVATVAEAALHAVEEMIYKEDSSFMGGSCKYGTSLCGTSTVVTSEHWKSLRM